ncbi:MAG: helix-turn-helix domain-containing protein [Streptomycetaceae bacterium]|nr:helix-turn-helix domain-containing protein [Streptomycetaceae bacterium]
MAPLSVLSTLSTASARGSAAADHLDQLAAALLSGAAAPGEPPTPGLPEDGTYAVLALTSVLQQPPDTLELPDALSALWHHPVRAGGRPHAYAIVLLGTAPLDDLVRALDPPPGTRAGVSAAVRGLAAVPRARELAERALRVSPDEPVAVLAERLPAALVADSPDLAALILARALGPVLELPDADRDSLLNTLRAWLESGGSTKRAGDRLFYHPNTVLNRLRRYEHLTGRVLADPTTVVELTLALEAHRLTTRR